MDQISYILRHNLPTSMIVLQALLRSALVGSARAVFALLPADPSTRLQNAKVLVAQEGKGFMQALDCYTGFEQLAGLRPDAEYLATVRQQNLPGVPQHVPDPRPEHTILGHNSNVFIIECQVRYVMNCLRLLANTANTRAIEVRAETMAQYGDG